MPSTDWRLKGQWLKNCNCNFGCPCDFDAPPTHGTCYGIVAMNVTEGHYGTVDLDGAHFVLIMSFPGPIYEGNGTLQVVIEQRASVAQRGALLAIVSGKDSAAGTVFDVWSAFITTTHEPVFAPIDFDFNIDGRTAYVLVPGIVESTSQPILNPVTGAAHRARIQLPDGLEYHEGEIANAATRGLGRIRFDIESGHSTLALVEHTGEGLVA
jgi:hypothetical protein